MSAVLDQMLRDLTNCEGLDPKLREIFGGMTKPTLTEAEQIKKLRSALHGMVDLVASFESVELDRSLPVHEAEAIYDSELENARLVLLVTTP